VSQSAQTQDEPARAPEAVTAALRPLRLPLASALLAYLSLLFLISLGRVMNGEELISGTAGPSFAERASGQQGSYLGLITLGLLALVVFLVAAREPLKVARPVVLATMVLTAFGLLMGFIGMLAGFFADRAGGLNSTRDKIEGALLDLPMIGLYVLFALFLLALLGADGLPRPAKSAGAQPYGQYSGPPQPGGIPGFPLPEQQAYGYQQPPQQGQSYDPWQGYPQQGYQQHQPEQSSYQPQQPEQAPYQPPQRPPDQAPYYPPEQSYRAPDPQPQYRQPEPSRQPEPTGPAEFTQSPFAPYQPPTEHDRPGPTPSPSPPPAWPQQPAPTQPLPGQDQQRPEDPERHPDQIQDPPANQHRNDSPDPPQPHAGWSGPHL